MQIKISMMILLCLFSVIFVMVPHHSAQANNKYASLVIDADSGTVISQRHAGKHRYPASLTKMMTLYLTFRAIENQKLHMNQKLKVSSRAQAQPSSKLGLKRGETITVRDAIMSLIIKSANDASVVLAEGIAGSEWQFAMMMNRMAKRLGMNHTHFINSNGLHDRRQKTTAYDMARLAVALKRDYRKYYHLFNRTRFYYKGQMYITHNAVVKSYRGSDGLKTGYTRASGYNLVTSATRDGHNIVAVVMGGRSAKRRDRHMVNLLNRSFSKINKGQGGSYTMATGKIPVPTLKPGKSYSVMAVQPKTNIAKHLPKITIAPSFNLHANNAPVPRLKPQIFRRRDTYAKTVRFPVPQFKPTVN